MKRNRSYLLPGVIEVTQSPFLPMDGFRLGVTGGRDFYDARFIWESLDAADRMYQITELGSGCAAGLDGIALEWAKRRDIPWRCYHADWDSFGDGAGSIRNLAYLEDFQPDRLAVFPGGRGTTHCARAARKMKIKRDFYTPDDDPLLEALRWG